MKIFDMHIHSYFNKRTPEALLEAMESAGVYGGCVFSEEPKESSPETGVDFENRLAEILAWSKGHEDRIFPVLWIHPFEENILEKVKIAAEAGIAAFKIICTNFYVYDERCMAVLREIARLDKPVIFHSGILWDGQVSSQYNRPLNWEALLEIEGLKFSMGHCSWPWIDECIALYGKFLHAKRGAEMFFDLTPGTPEIYRKELFTKLYTVGYDVGDNLMFGTDCSGSHYRGEWADKWLKLDGRIMDELGISLENREKLYAGNLMRFLGKGEKLPPKTAPAYDDAHPWSGVNPEVKGIIEKWYEKLEFPDSYKPEFKKALKSIPISDAISIESHDIHCEDGKRNLLSFLYLCEKLEQFYKSRKIPEEILLDTLRDIPRWTVQWSNVKGELHLGQLDWLSLHMRGTLFKLGRLQFCPGKMPLDAPEFGLKKGDPVLAIHIPADGKLDPEEAKKSLDLAREFYAKFFPDYDYACFTCESWLLDDSLKKYLPETSNIIRFGDLFVKLKHIESNGLIRYLFRWDTTEENLPYAVCNSDFAKKVKKAILRGESFHRAIGIIEK